MPYRVGGVFATLIALICHMTRIYRTYEQHTEAAYKHVCIGRKTHVKERAPLECQWRQNGD